MADSKDDRKSNKHDEMVPAPWVAALLASWDACEVVQVEVRKGPKGALRCIGAQALAEVVVQDEDFRDAATTVAQQLWDLAYNYHLDVGGTVDAQLVLMGKDGEIGRVRTGGRMRGGETEDPEDDGGLNLRTSMWAIDKLIKLNVDTIARTNEIIAGVAPFYAQAGNIRAAEIQAEADMLKAHAMEEVVSRAMERFAPILERWAEARKNDSVSGRNRRPTGDPVVDAWRTCVEAVDLPTAERIRTVLPEDGQDLLDALAVGDQMNAPEILTFWRGYRARERVIKGWRGLLAILPERARDALPGLADAIREAERKGGDGDG